MIKNGKKLIKFLSENMSWFLWLELNNKRNLLLKCWEQNKFQTW